MKENDYKEYTIINPANGKYQQIVANDGSEIVQVFNTYLEVEEYFESEAYHLPTYVEKNNLIMHTETKKFTSIEDIKKIIKNK